MPSLRSRDVAHHRLRVADRAGIGQEHDLAGDPRRRRLQVPAEVLPAGRLVERPDDLGNVHPAIGLGRVEQVREDERRRRRSDTRACRGHDRASGGNGRKPRFQVGPFRPCQVDVPQAGLELDDRGGPLHRRRRGRIVAQRHDARACCPSSSPSFTSASFVPLGEGPAGPGLRPLPRPGRERSPSREPVRRGSAVDRRHDRHPPGPPRLHSTPRPPALPRPRGRSAGLPARSCRACRPRTRARRERRRRGLGARRAAPPVSVRRERPAGAAGGDRPSRRPPPSSTGRSVGTRSRRRPRRRGARHAGRCTRSGAAARAVRSVSRPAAREGSGLASASVRTSGTRAFRPRAEVDLGLRTRLRRAVCEQLRVDGRGGKRREPQVLLALRRGLRRTRDQRLPGARL